MSIQSQPINRLADNDAQAWRTEDQTQRDQALAHIQRTVHNITQEGGGLVQQTHWRSMRNDTALPDLQFSGDGSYLTAVPTSAQRIKEVTGRPAFKQDEQLRINADGTVTSLLKDPYQPGSFRETTYKDAQILQIADNTVHKGRNIFYFEFRDKNGKIVSQKFDDGTNTMERKYDKDGGYEQTLTDKNTGVVTHTSYDKKTGFTQSETRDKDNKLISNRHEDASGVRTRTFKDGNVEAIWFNPRNPSEPATMTTAEGVTTYGDDGKGKATWFNPTDRLKPSTKTTAEGVTTYHENGVEEFKGHVSSLWF